MTEASGGFAVEPRDREGDHPGPKVSSLFLTFHYYRFLNVFP